MITALFSRIIVLVLGTLYPAYASYKAIRTKDVREYVKWMMYWVVFAFFTTMETMTDLVLSFWFPFYYECKMILILWLLLPATQGSSYLYRRFVHPLLTEREKEIDDFLDQAKDRSYRAALDFGSRGINYATQIIVSTAMRGGAGFLHLTRSYSVGDVPRMRGDVRSLIGADEVDLLANRRSLPPVLDDSEEETDEFQPVSEPNYIPSRQQVVTRKTRRHDRDQVMKFSEYSPNRPEPSLKRTMRSSTSETIYLSSDSGRPATPQDPGPSRIQRGGSFRARASSKESTDRGSTSSVNAVGLEKKPRRKAAAQSDEPFDDILSDPDFEQFSLDDLSDEDNMDFPRKEVCPYHGHAHSGPRVCKHMDKRRKPQGEQLRNPPATKTNPALR